MRIPYVTTFCCLCSVHMGALLIVYINNFISFLAFVSWASNAYGMYQRLRYNNVNSEIEHTALAWITIAFGLLLVTFHAYMSFVIMIGLQKDEPRYLQVYMRLGYVSLFLNTCNTILTFFVHYNMFIFSSGYLFFGWMSIPLQCYFMLVIRSTIKEMLEEHNELSSSRNNDVCLEL